ncbi:5-formyltetrahydrofolate cyclo-ligase [Phocaeicola paurosaccharolyticus]|uniref:5-formyltetrahydrofolate cyclo-ligase n=1 Tax=Phocaeicola paurosaccharolyticus TaxID=732242 RepID=UPI001F3CEA3D|nr:5-formyltetrahydrofolate cyclo-ligase [Phocaeicola paurosaccharolyticus]
MLRQQIKDRKRCHQKEQLSIWSLELLKKIETIAAFKEAATVLLYYSIADEVQTAEFIKRWCKEKCILLPVICGDELVLRKYVNEEKLTDQNSFRIKEPSGNDFTEFDKIDIAIIPGMAFDRNHNRLGRGKGFYDRLLPKIKAPKIGICFSFQVVDEVPVDELDIPLDEVWTENGKLL